MELQRIIATALPFVVQGDPDPYITNLTPDILYGEAKEGTVCHYHPHPPCYNLQYPDGYYVYLRGGWVRLSEQLRTVVLDSNFETYETISYEILPMAVWISHDGKFAQQTSVDFCQYIKVDGGWVHSCDLAQKKQEGFVPKNGMWLPVDRAGL